MAQIFTIHPADIKAWVEADEAIIVDVREPQEYAQEHIHGATLIPLSVFDPAKVPVPPEGKKLVIHCQSGVRCGMASQKLAQSGWEGDIFRMQGGIYGWRAVGGPTEA